LIYVNADGGNVGSISGDRTSEAPHAPNMFLAKLLGLYCIIVALAMMTRKQNAVATIKAPVANPPLLLLAEVIGLACGLAMIIGHNIWSGGALPVVVTFVGWLMVIRGAGLLALSPAGTAKLVEALR
jgi:hypothetical protein